MHVIFTMNFSERLPFPTVYERYQTFINGRVNEYERLGVLKTHNGAFASLFGSRF